MTHASVLVKSAVATSAAVLLVAHRDQVGGRSATGEATGSEATGGCPVLRALGRVPAQARALEPDALGYPEYSV